MNYKLSVDHYELSNNNFNCFCFIPNGNEENYMERTVTIEALKESVCDKFGNVRCTYINDTQDSEDITFDIWLANNSHQNELYDALADVINKREGRKLIASFPSKPVIK